MDIVVALIGLAMIVIVAAYVAHPLVVRTRIKAAASFGDSPRDKLMAERNALYATIRDLDFDFQTGKLLEADYRTMRDKYTTRGVEILKELEAMSEVGGRKSEVRGWRSEVGGQKAEVVDEIEVTVQARRKAKPVQVASVEDEIEAAVRARRQSSIPNTQYPIPDLKCPNCGRPVDSSDRFCGKCGASVTVEATR